MIFSAKLSSSLLFRCTYKDLCSEFWEQLLCGVQRMVVCYRSGSAVREPLIDGPNSLLYCWQEKKEQSPRLIRLPARASPLCRSHPLMTATIRGTLANQCSLIPSSLLLSTAMCRPFAKTLLSQRFECISSDYILSDAQVGWGLGHLVNSACNISASAPDPPLLGLVNSLGRDLMKHKSFSTLFSYACPCCPSWEWIYHLSEINGKASRSYE